MKPWYKVSIAALAVGVICTTGAAHASLLSTISVSGKETVHLAGLSSPISVPSGFSESDYFGDLTDVNTIPQFVDVTGLYIISISASGTWGHGPNLTSGPEGRGFTDAGTLIQYEEFGIAILNNADLNLLLGAFTDSTGPSLGNAPSRLTVGSDDMTMPGLNQAFGIGASLANIMIPIGATKFYLGLHNGFEWTNNVGSVSVDISAVPEPSTIVVFLIGLVGLGFMRRYRLNA